MLASLSGSGMLRVWRSREVKARQRIDGQVNNQDNVNKSFVYRIAADGDQNSQQVVKPCSDRETQRNQVENY